MKLIVEVPIKKGYAPVMRLVDKPNEVLRIGSSIVIDRVKAAVTESKIGDIVEHKFFDWIPEPSLAVEVEIEAYEMIAKDHPQIKDGIRMVYHSMYRNR